MDAKGWGRESMYSVLTAGRTLSISHLRSPVFKTEPP